MKKLITYLPVEKVIEDMSNVIHIFNTVDEKYEAKRKNPRMLVATIKDMFKESNFFGMHASGVLIYDIDNMLIM